MTDSSAKCKTGSPIWACLITATQGPLPRLPARLSLDYSTSPSPFPARVNAICGCFEDGNGCLVAARPWRAGTGAAPRTGERHSRFEPAEAEALQ